MEWRLLTQLHEPRPRKAAIKLIPADAGDAETYIAGWAATKSLSHPHLMSPLTQHLKPTHVLPH